VGEALITAPSRISPSRCDTPPRCGCHPPSTVNRDSDLSFLLGPAAAALRAGRGAGAPRSAEPPTASACDVQLSGSSDGASEIRDPGTTAAAARPEPRALVRCKPELALRAESRPCTEHAPLPRLPAPSTRAISRCERGRAE
jgi:hypothetical protein